MSTKLKTLVQLFAVGVGIGVVLFELRPAVWSVINIAGVGLTMPAFALWATARLQLGDSFSVSAQARNLVTHGLYSKIRNPVYVFGTLFIVGVALAINRPLLLLVLPVILPMQVIRARAEAKVLEAKFGDAYREYRSHTWF